MYMYHIFIYLSVNKQLGCFHILAIENGDSMNIGVHISLHIRVLVLFPGTYLSGIAEFLIFNFVGGNLQTDFYSSCINRAQSFPFFISSPIVCIFKFSKIYLFLIEG